MRNAKVSKKDTSPAINVSEHGKYQVKSGRLAGEFVARAFPKPPTRARGLIAEAIGETEEAAIAALHELIDARENRRVDERRKDARTGETVPSVEEYVEAIYQVLLSQPQRAMLMALSLADEDGLPAARIANAAGYKSQGAANRSLASVGLLIANYLSLETIAVDSVTGFDGISFLGFRGKPRDDEDPGNWILHPELRNAIRAVQ